MGMSNWYKIGFAQQGWLNQLEKMTIKAIENCKTCQCNECPFNGRPSHCLAVLEHLIKSNGVIAPVRNVISILAMRKQAKL